MLLCLMMSNKLSWILE